MFIRFGRVPVAFRQTNIKSVLAYNSIAHAGHVLVAHFSRDKERYLEVEDMAGLGERQPMTAALFTIFLLSLIGVPPTGGFFGKFYIFKSALDANLLWLTVLGLLTSAVAAYYYLRIIVVMYFRDPSEATATLEPLATANKIALWICAAATLVLGLYPSLVLDFANQAAATLGK